METIINFENFPKNNFTCDSLKEFIECNLIGLKYILISKYLSRDCYDKAFAKININADKSEKPKESCEEIFNEISKCLNLKIKYPGKYRVSLYKISEKNSASSEQLIIKTKYIDFLSQSLDEENIENNSKNLNKIFNFDGIELKILPNSKIDIKITKNNTLINKIEDPYGNSLNSFSYNS